MSKGTRKEPYVFVDVSQFYIQDRGMALCVDLEASGFTDLMNKDLRRLFMGKYLLYNGHKYKILGYETMVQPNKHADKTAFLLKPIDK